jgi:hypothetical protein
MLKLNMKLATLVRDYHPFFWFGEITMSWIDQIMPPLPL